MQKLKIAVIGSNVYETPFVRAFSKFDVDAVYLNQCVQKMKEVSQVGESYLDMARYYIEKNRCPRTNDNVYKEKLVETIKQDSFSGVIVNTFKFCDFYPFDQMYIKKALGDDIPVLGIEHDLMSRDEGQIMTRLEAFFESIRKKGRGRASATAKGDYFVGIDSGSHATKAVCLDKGRTILSSAIVSTGTSVKGSGKEALDKVLKEAGIKRGDVAKIVATGYGRENIDFADESVTEITCHALGANYILRDGGTIIDIGGQDSKAIKINKDGAVQKFAMNDKCAAGTGRFLEVIADRLEMTLEEFARLAVASKGAVAVSSMCSVFAESEVISLIASGSSKEEISRGIHQSIAARTASLVKRVEGEPPYYMSGGVAKNRAMVKELSDSLDSNVTVIKNPQIVGALGAAIHAAGK